MADVYSLVLPQATSNIENLRQFNSMPVNFGSRIYIHAIGSKLTTEDKPVSHETVPPSLGFEFTSKIIGLIVKEIPAGLPHVQISTKHMYSFGDVSEITVEGLQLNVYNIETFMMYAKRWNPTVIENQVIVYECGHDLQTTHTTNHSP